MKRLGKCLHCGDEPAVIIGRGLCGECYRDEAVRQRYPCLPAGRPKGRIDLTPRSLPSQLLLGMRKITSVTYNGVELFDAEG